MHRGVAVEPQLPQLDVYPARHQRRLTVFFRLLLLIPQLIAVWLLGIVTFFAAIAAWFAALVLGRLPEWASTYLAGYVRYTTRVYASLYFLVDSYPPFSFDAPGWPVQVELHPGELNRLAVLFRIILVIPAAIITSVVQSGWQALAFFCWLTVLIMGRTPEPLFDASTAVLRYTMRFQAYFLMLSSSYPKRLFGDPEAAGALPQGTVVQDPAGIQGSGGYEAGAGGTGGYEAGGGSGTAPAGTGPQDAPAPGDLRPGTPGGETGADGLPQYTGSQEPQYADPRYAEPQPQYAGAVPDPRLRATGPQGTVGPSPTRPLLLTTGAKVLLAVFIVAGLLAGGLSGGFGSNNNNTNTTVTTSSAIQP
jgi:hypothetical protein